LNCSLAKIVSINRFPMAIDVNYHDIYNRKWNLPNKEDTGAKNKIGCNFEDTKLNKRLN
jgi:hypothetical protein